MEIKSTINILVNSAYSDSVSWADIFWGSWEHPKVQVTHKVIISTETTWEQHAKINDTFYMANANRNADAPQGWNEH